MADILILAAHPDLAQSRVNRALLDAVGKTAAPHISVRDLYRLYPDYSIDVAAEQSALQAAQLLVLLHPLQWYGMPALQKLWFDEVLRFGWAYGPGGQALLGKDLWLVGSTGGTRESYSAAGHHGHPVEAFLLPYAQSARVCGLRFLPPLLLHGAHQTSDTALAEHAQGFVQQLLNFPNWCPQQSEEDGNAPQIPLDDRPALFSSLDGARA